MPVTKDDVLSALGAVPMPGSGKSIVEADVLRAVTVDDGRVSFILEVDPAQGAALEPTRAAAQAAVEALPGVRSVSALLTAHGPAPKAPPPPDLKIGRHPTPQAGPRAVPGVRRVIAVASGKGGVGKSTVAANLAVALAAEGRAIGLLDADIYGPSQPRMMGVSGRPRSPDGKTILPLHNHGVTIMSIGLMLREGEAVVWRGPMLMGALQQLMGQVAWGELDALIVDLPPGTGDVQLTLSQKYELTGAILVSTPQDIALLDARKALDMFDKTKVPVIGLVENMSSYICPNCGHEAHIFGHGGAKAEAARLGLPFLGEVPLDIAIRQAGDSGVPAVAAHPESPEAEAFRAIARRLISEGVV
ncbi:Mrp/NBP35 family ATP-binding protein [Amaricoccus solimangrovi]|uniref:Iron-sulfur cluster carrier protein n=1 Tax=Amaricoccus solimangrovi TaxID=2589815 RepID=A0A501WTX0_9RHOB|nr:Mrp/NBP35 family ATP-binding protein [Amaricoccus solimangrovi]TPE50797.1 Mrp/NBP35 family ATP-binding protein [Amaricoccus solimangrovi]